MIRFLKIKPIDSIGNQHPAKQTRSKPLCVDFISLFPKPFFMKHIRFACATWAVFSLFSCDKNNPPAGTGDPLYRIVVNNEFNPLEAKFAVFLSDPDGKILIYKDIEPYDTTHLEVPGSSAGDLFDCTVVRISTLDAPGSGVKDTLVQLTTYTRLPAGETLNLRNLFFQQITDLNVTFTGATTIDSIIVPDGLTFVRPQPFNNFNGQYQILHTGKFWIRLKANGEPGWRFILFENVTGSTFQTTVDVNLMLPIFAAPATLTFPFPAPWQYNLDGVVDTAALRFVPLGDQLRAPGGAIPVFNQTRIFQPVSNDVFNPEPKPYKGFRFRATGSDASPGGYTYFCDFFSDSVPKQLPQPAFDLLPTVLSDNRLVATQCAGSFDVLVFARSRSGTPNINWEVYIPPVNGIVMYRLPDVPPALGDRFPVLKNYDFGGAVKARAERYEQLNYPEAVHRKLSNTDPLWQAKGGYTGREEIQ
jgi:hypothetical protein